MGRSLRNSREVDVLLTLISLSFDQFLGIIELEGTQKVQEYTCRQRSGISDLVDDNGA